MDSGKENGSYYLGFEVGGLGFQGSVGDAGWTIWIVMREVRRPLRISSPSPTGHECVKGGLRTSPHHNYA